MNKFNFVLVIATALTASHANAAGFEKSVMWSGKHAGYAGAAVSTVTGGQSLFFNPAGLAGPGDVSLNFSPTWIKVKGHLVTTTDKLESNSGTLPFGGVVASYNMGRFGFGMGYYVVGGEKAKYDSVDLSGNAGVTVAFRPNLLTDLEVTETAFGAGMELFPGLRVGAAWRINKAKGELSTVKRITAAVPVYSFLHVKDVKQTQYDGWKLGMQYEAPDKNWGIGLSYRSRVTFDAPGTATGTTVTVIASPGTEAAQTMSPVVRIGVVFPEAYNFGAHYMASPKTKIVSGIDFVKYSKTDNIYVTGTANGSTLPNIPLEWHDMWNLRLGFEHECTEAVVLRAGYAFTTQVTSSTHAKATLPPPGKGHLFTLGGGYSLMKNLDLDGAFEYSFNSGTGSMSMPTGTSRELLAGVSTETKATVIGVHTGLTYKF